MFGIKRSLKREDVLRILDTIRGPNSQSIVHAGLIEYVRVTKTGDILVTIAVPKGQESAAERWQQEAATAVKQLSGVGKVTIVRTAHQDNASIPSPPSSIQRVRKGVHLNEAALDQTRAVSVPIKAGIPGITRIVAVASAKGGVGKSTVAVNLAAAFQVLGIKVGLLDLDIYGPSIPTMLGTQSSEPEIGADKRLLPVMAHGLKTMSIGYLVDGDAPMIWRGPIVTSAIKQLLEDVTWGTLLDPLDLLLLDTPPGTGDAQLALAQRVPLDGAVIVSTPQEVALADVRRGAAMFAKTHVPILGVIENMAWLMQQDGSKLHLFGEGGAKRTAEALGLPFLGEIALEQGLRESGDVGVAYVHHAPASPTSSAFLSIAAHIYDGLVNQKLKPGPKISFVD
ncbi:Mrp/NBP35 family ATP-binding protein [Candidatus Phycosocius spiralis]|uniref:Iron-sulfur cluster carrier protein n=1 Tax=Candidatus Phycosocius spiralis TaxID=2815099 RepID=A0ABQ4PVL9_9PROT|nr:Mrp/NBP35 family ATP-binding protein [Candidatus Phycosocius spiralis]GIU67043.1 iron-sulfur cluster carrier protein [Candidatus Phycosocius spiralis]